MPVGILQTRNYNGLVLLYTGTVAAARVAGIFSAAAVNMIDSESR